MSRIVDVEARKSNGVYEFGWKQVMVIDIDIDSPAISSTPAGFRRIRELQHAVLLASAA
jgi:hypothetical protein